MGDGGIVRSKHWTVRLADLLISLVLLALALAAFLPLWHTLVVSLSDKAAAEAGLVGFWPHGFSIAPYLYILGDMSFWRAFLVSLERVALGGSISLILTILTAFPLSRSVRQFPARDGLMWLVLVAMLFSAGLVPWYLTIRYLGLIDSIWALVLPTAVPIWNVIILMNFFRNIPKEIDEAAELDGAGPWTLLFKIYVPMSTPALATVTLFSVVGLWNSWFDGIILMNNPAHYPLMSYIQQLVVAQRQDLGTVDYSVMAQLSNTTLNGAKLMIAVVPILLIYPLLQRYFVQGITLGSVKE